MIVDRKNAFSPPVFAVGVATYPGEDVSSGGTLAQNAYFEFADHIDLGARKDTFQTSDSPDGGEAELWLNAVVKVAGAGGGGTIRMSIWDNTAEAVGTLLLTLGDFVVGANGNAAVGDFLSVRLPGGVINRYLYGRAQAIDAGITAGTIHFWIGPGPIQNPAR